MAAFLRETGVPGILGDKHASGTAIIEELGEEHVRTGKPILYTSADSVLQIAATRRPTGSAACSPIARSPAASSIPSPSAASSRGPSSAPDAPTSGARQPRDYAIPPPEPTLLTRVETAGGRG